MAGPIGCRGLGSVVAVVRPVSPLGNGATFGVHAGVGPQPHLHGVAVVAGVRLAAGQQDVTG